VPQKELSIRIDGELVSTTEGKTILEAARSSGKYIPTLCYLEGLSAVGGCRLCVVQVAGIDRLLPACTTPVQNGMAVTTTSPKLAEYRKMAVELLLVERNHVCAVCVSNGHCELQSMAGSLGVTHVRYPYDYPKLPLDMSHERFVLDQNRCILCTRCVRVCTEIEGAHTWDIQGRGVNSRLISDLEQPWGTSDTCTSCGKCIQACPTGALFEKSKVGIRVRKDPDFLSYLKEMREGAR